MSQINLEESVSLIGSEIKKSENAWFSVRKKRQRIDLKTEAHILYLEKGTVSVYRIDDDLVTVTIPAPAILGLAQLRALNTEHYLRCDGDCEMWVMSMQNAKELFTQKNLWRDAFDLLSHHLGRYFQRETLKSHRTIRELVIEHVKYIWSLASDIRKKTSIYTFIMTRNHVSRSAIHKVLQELVLEGRITIEHGKLTSYVEPL